MKFKIALINDFNDLVNEREIICFCASNHFKNYIDKNGRTLWMDKIRFFIDNNYEKIDTFELTGLGMRWDVKNPAVLKEYNRDYVILVLS